MRNFKLLEGIGLLLVLGSWCLEWQSVQKWNTAESEYWRFVTTFHDAIYRTEDRLQNQFQIAITRSVQGLKLNPKDFSSAYKLAWGYDEVRQIWLEKAQTGMVRVNTLITSISDYARKYRLKLKTDLKAIDNSRAKISHQLSTLVDWQDPVSKVLPIPNQSFVSVADAGRLDNEIRALIARLTPALDEVLQAIRAQRDFWSSVYRLIFAIGSVLLIGVKIDEWRHEKNRRLP